MALPLLAVSGEELAGALQRAGFQLVSRKASGEMVLSYACRDLLISPGPVGPDALRALLRDAGLSYSIFLDMLEAKDARFESQVRLRFRTLA